MKRLLSWGGVGLVTSAILDPLIHSMLDLPVPWLRDCAMLAAGAACLYLLVKFRLDL